MTKKISAEIESFKPINWVFDASYWRLPLNMVEPAETDAFMLGGNGRISARMGMQEKYSTIDRLMGPEFDSYGYHQNNYFRKTVIGISGEYPDTCITEWQRLWRVPGTAIVCTRERVFLKKTGYRNVEIITINYVLPLQPALMRLVVVKNCSLKAVEGIRLVVDAEPDVIWPKPGHSSEIRPYGKGRLMETVTEFKTNKNCSRPEDLFTDEVQRYRYCLRGLTGGKNRGWDQLASEELKLGPGDEKIFLCYMVIGDDNTLENIERTEEEILTEIKRDGVFADLERTRQFWSEWRRNKLHLVCSDRSVSDFLDAATVHAKQAEHHTGGFMVGDDYTQAFCRDLNGPHRLLLWTGHFDEVRRSMDFIFYADVWAGRFCNSYFLDMEDLLAEPEKPYWFEQVDCLNLADEWNCERVIGEQDPDEIKRFKHMTPGDVPNIRVLWYWWYHLWTGDLELVELRWEYLKALIRLQHFEEHGYLAGYSRDETYGIEPG